MVVGKKGVSDSWEAKPKAEWEEMNPMTWICERVYRNQRSWFWTRETFHFAGGVLLGMVSNLFKPFWVTFLIGGGLLVVILVKEIREDNVSQPRFKTYIDCISWNLGFWLVAWEKFL
jgi:hypothetical protein